MEENKTPPTFTWTGYGDVTPLPTDYSPKYLEGRWKINDSKISAYITKHLDFEYFYQWMRYVSPEHHRTEPFDYRGIPAELEPFFHEYIKEAISRKIKPDSLQLDERILKDFDNDLALHLHRMASAAEQNYIAYDLRFYKELAYLLPGTQKLFFSAYKVRKGKSQGKPVHCVQQVGNVIAVFGKE